MTHEERKNAVRDLLRGRLAAMSVESRRAASVAACGLLTASPEFAAARVVMIYLSMPTEVDTSPIALRCWQNGKTVVAPKVGWAERHMYPIEINSLHGLETNSRGLREPAAGNPIPINLIDLVIVPALGFSRDGFRIGRGMGFYDRFLAVPEFIGLSCGLAFEDQVLEDLPVVDHDMPLSMLVTEVGIRRFASNLINS